MRQVIPIPPDRASEFDLVVDVAIRPKASFDDSRAWTRLRVRLNEVITPGGREKLAGVIDTAVSGLLDAGVTIPEASDDAT